MVLLFVEPSQQLFSLKLLSKSKPACRLPWAARPAPSSRRRATLEAPPCGGARAYLDALPNNLALYAVPAATLSAFADRIAALARANETLTKFHQLRRQYIEAGAAPTVQDSLRRSK